MNFDLVTNIETCFNYIETSTPINLVYYSHIPTMLVSLAMAFFVYFKSNKSLLSKVLLSIAVVFSLWLSGSFVAWTSVDSSKIIFAWSLLSILDALFFILCLYFVYVFINKKDASLKIKIVLGLLTLPIIALTPTIFNLSSFDILECAANENNHLLYYLYLIESLVSMWIIFIVAKGYKNSDIYFRRQILLMAIGIVLFLLSFLFTGFLGSYLAESGMVMGYEYELYGLFGMTFFMGVLAYMIVKFKAFDIKLLGAQALVATLTILIGSQYAFINNPTNKVLNGITLALSLVFGWFLVQSVKKEVKRKEELQRLSDKLAAANERLRQLDIEKSEFISIASHQLRTPLTAIKGYISLILEGSYGTVTASIQDVLEKVYSVNSRLVHLVEDLLNVSRIEAGRIQYNFEPTQLEPLVAELVDMFAPTAKNKGLTLQMRLPKVPLPKLTVDPNKIKEVVSNLIDNSLKYTKEGGTTVTLEQAGDQARIIVSDTGIGIKPADLGKLFEKFVRTKETAKMVASGTGLGLFVGRNFVEAHGGRIWAESPAVPSEGGQAPVKGEGAGKGSRFIVELPLVNPKIKAGTSDQQGIGARDMAAGAAKPPETA